MARVSIEQLSCLKFLEKRKIRCCTAIDRNFFDKYLSFFDSSPASFSFSLFESARSNRARRTSCLSAFLFFPFLFSFSFFSPTENNNKFERYIQPWMNFTRNDDGIVTFIVFIVKRKIFYNTQLMRLVSYFSFFLFSTSLSTRYTLTSIITIGLKPLP